MLAAQPQRNPLTESLAVDVAIENIARGLLLDGHLLSNQSTKGALLMKPSEQHTFNILFLCTGNSARSIMAEAIMKGLGRGRFHAYSAGSMPTGRVNPFALEQMEHASLPTTGYRSKSWDEFAKPGAPVMDFVFTVCDSAAAETCPIWPGKPATAHWGVPDPAAVQGNDDAKRKAFNVAFVALRQRISIFMALPFEKLHNLALKEQLVAIGRTAAPSDPQ